MLREALAFPRERTGATRDLLLGGALVLTSPLILPGLLVWGYLLRVMDVGARSRDTPPVLGNWERLLTDGLRAAVVVIAWGLLPLVVLVAASLGWALFVLGPGPDVGAPAAVLEMVTPQVAGMVLAVVVPLGLLAFVLWLHVPAALAAVGTQGRLGAAFQTGALWAVVNTRQYLVGIVLAGLVAVLGSLLATLLAPVLVGFVLSFYVQVTAAYLIGRAVGGAAVTAIRPA